MKKTLRQHPDPAKVLTWCRTEYRDDINPKMYTAISCSVLAPSFDRPYVSIIVTIANAGGKVKFRCTTVDTLKGIIFLSTENEARLRYSVQQGEIKANAIKDKFKLAYEARNLPPGTKVYRGDTGEAIYES